MKHTKTLLNLIAQIAAEAYNRAVQDKWDSIRRNDDIEVRKIRKDTLTFAEKNSNDILSELREKHPECKFSLRIEFEYGAEYDYYSIQQEKISQAEAKRLIEASPPSEDKQSMEDLVNHAVTLIHNHFKSMENIRKSIKKKVVEWSRKESVEVD